MLRRSYLRSMDNNVPGRAAPADAGGIHQYKSEGERRIARVLDQYGIPFVYEPKIPVRDNGTTRYLVPDFYLPRHNTYIEYYGRAGNTDYDRRTQRKEALYVDNQIPVLALYPWSLCQDWPGRLLDYLGNNGAPRPTTHGYSAQRAKLGYSPRPASRGYAGIRSRMYR